MANVIKLKKGLNIHLAGKAAEEVFVAKASKVYGLVPDAFVGVKPKVVVKEGDVVKVKITKVKDGKVSLSMKALEEAPAPSEDDIPELSQVVSHEKATTNLGDLLKNIKLD